MCSNILRSALICFCIGEVWSSNNRPVIGILFQEPADRTYGDTYLMADYVQYVEAAGALAVPIRVKENDEYYEDLFSKINGALFPGGGVSLFTSGYAIAAKKLVNLAIAARDKGDYFPIWGTCLGSQMLIQIAYGSEPYLQSCSAEDVMLPLDLLPDAKESRILKDIPEDVLYVLTHYNVTPNYHKYCFTPKVYSGSARLKESYRPIAVNRDVNGVEFISMYEARNYPIYGTQFHPEKITFEWSPIQHVNHSFGAVKVAQYFANFFVNEARKNNHHYPDNDTLAKELFYNYQPVFFPPPKMYANYYLNYTQPEDEDPFEEEWRDLKGDTFMSFWKKEKLNTSYMIGSLVVFFLLGISFVFVMDYAIALSGKLFNITLRHPQDNVCITGSENVKVKLIDSMKLENSEVKVPLLDGPEVGI